MSVLSFGVAPWGVSMGLNLSKDLFFSSPNFGQKIGVNFSEDLCFFSLHLVLGKKSE